MSKEIFINSKTHCYSNMKMLLKIAISKLTVNGKVFGNFKDEIFAAFEKFENFFDDLLDKEIHLNSKNIEELLRKTYNDQIDIDLIQLLIVSLNCLNKEINNNTCYLYLNTSDVDVQKQADKIANDYIVNHLTTCENNNFINKYLSLILKEVLNEYWVRSESDPNFRISLMTTANNINDVTMKNNKMLNDLCTQKIKINLSNKKRIKYNLLSDFRSMWNSRLFLEPIDSKVRICNTYVTPEYKGYKDNFYNGNIDSLLTDFLLSNLENDFLVIVGQPGSGKSTLISYILNDYKYKDLNNKYENIYVYRFSELSRKGVNFNDDVNNWFEQFDNICNLNLDKLENSFLIFDGLDELNLISEDKYEDLLKNFNKKIYNSQRNVKVMITSRFNRFNLENLKKGIKFIEVLPFRQDKISTFINKYNKNSINQYDNLNFSLSDISCIEKVIGIPHILYMIVASNIKIKEGISLQEIYSKIFSWKYRECSVYYKPSYDIWSRDITEKEAKCIHEFSKKIAIYMWENNYELEMVDKNKCKELSDEAISMVYGSNQNNIDMNLNRLLISQFFYQGTNENSNYIYFVHKTMYEYFVALSIFDCIEHIIKCSDRYDEIFKNTGNNIKDFEFILFAKLMGMSHINNQSNFEIKSFIIDMLKQNNYYGNTDYLEIFKKFLDDFLNFGLIQYSEDTDKPIVKIKKEILRFINIIQLIIEICLPPNKKYYEICDSKYIQQYLRFNDNYGICLRNLKISNINNLRGADLRGADLRNSFLQGSMRNIDLSGANLTDSIMTDCDFYRANFIGTTLINAKLTSSDFSHADLSGANLFKADLNNVNFNGTFLFTDSLHNSRHINSVNNYNKIHWIEKP